MQVPREERTAEKNRIRSVIKGTNNTYDSELFDPTGREFLAELSVIDPDRTIVEAHPAVTDELDEQIGVLEQKIEQRVLESPAAQLLLTIPGVGKTTAAVIVAELGEIDRFDTHKEVVSYAGLDPMVHQSRETELHGSISKEGQGACAGPSCNQHGSQYGAKTTSGVSIHDWNGRRTTRLRL